ncbi:MAG: ABC transporter permease [Bacillati bacterium ANGP1]|uniref:ABC transporter permease n=1 Tax=Candidatus Segetimicrobium genomatis TaxID=2569760 RepID=A0A537M0L0_9BACT|nr:MAG: ABC transporter permease [Terrabacteria group bacterium ANGP1]
MARFILRRLALLPPLLLGVSLFLFVLTHLVPADPAKLIAGEHAGPDQVAAVRKAFGLDRPLSEQYAVYLGRLAHGDLGTSMRTNSAVLDDLRTYFPATLELTGAAMLATVAIGVPLGMVGAIGRGGLSDLLAQFASLGGLSFPIFVFGLLMQLIFFRWLEWLPLAGRLATGDSPPAHITGLYVVDSLLTGNAATLQSSLIHLALPAFTLALASLAPTARMTRSTMLEILTQDFVRTAWAKGLAPIRVYLRHGLRNAFIPVITILGLQVSALLGGVFIVELIFAWPGLGLYSVEGILALDYSAIMGTALLLTAVYVVINLAVDVTYAVLDPRIRY